MNNKKYLLTFFILFSTLSHLDAMKDDTSNEKTSWFDAVRKEDSKEVKRLLLQNPGLLNAIDPNDMTTAAMKAALLNRSDSVLNILIRARRRSHHDK